MAPRYGDLQGRVVYDLGTRHSVNLLALTGWSAIALGRDSEEDDEFYGEYMGSQWTYGGNWRALWSDRFRSNTAVAFSRSLISDDWFDRRDDRSLYWSDNSDGSISIRNVNSLVGDGGRRLDFGGSMTLQRARFRYRSAEVTEGPNERHRPALEVEDRVRGTGGSAFISATAPLHPRLLATIGLRMEHSGVNDQTVLLPRVSGTYSLTDRVQLNGAAGMYAQALPLVFVSQDPSNRTLPHVRANHFVLGTEVLATPALRLTVEGYRKEYTDLPMSPIHPERLPVDDLLSGFDQLHGWLQAGGRAFSQGIEFMAQHPRVHRLHGLVSLALSESRYRDLEDRWRSRINDNRIIVQILAGFQPAPSWDLSARWIYGGGSPYTPVDQHESQLHGTTVFDFSQTNAERLPAYHSLHLRVDRWHHFRRTSLVAHLSLANAYNRENVRMYRWNRSDEKVEPVLSWGLLPILGFELKW